MVSANAPRDLGILTAAFGGDTYIEMAKWLAMSIRRNAPEIPLAVLTDSKDPELRTLFTHVVEHELPSRHFLEVKMQLDKFTPFAETLFIDSDCLVINDLSTLLPQLIQQDFAIPGWRYLSHGEVDGNIDVPFVLDHFKLDRLPKFNGGCYFFRRGPVTESVFGTARDLLARAAEIRVHALPNGDVPDEPLFALALVLNGLELTPTGDRGPWTPINSRGPIQLDLLAGQCSFWKEGAMVYPDIIHFPAGFRDAYCYHREVWRLNQLFGRPVPPASQRINAMVRGTVSDRKRQLREQARRMRAVLRGQSQSNTPVLRPTGNGPFTTQPAMASGKEKNRGTL